MHPILSSVSTLEMFHLHVHTSITHLDTACGCAFSSICLEVEFLTWIKNHWNPRIYTCRYIIYESDILRFLQKEWWGHFGEKLCGINIICFKKRFFPLSTIKKNWAYFWSSTCITAKYLFYAVNNLFGWEIFALWLLIFVLCFIALFKWIIQSGMSQMYYVICVSVLVKR